MNKTNDGEVLTIDVHFSEGLCLLGISHLAIELMKNLLFQRKQIPLTVDVIKQDLGTTRKSSIGHADGLIHVEGAAHVQAELRRRRLEAKQRRIREKYLKRAETFVQNFDELQVEFMDQLST